MDNAQVTEVLDEIADLLEIQGQSAFRVRAYRSAARTVESLGQPVSRMSVEALCELPGIAADLAGKIEEIARTGTHPMLAELTANVPETVVKMMRIPGVGPKRAKLLYEELGLTTIEALASAARDGRLDAVRGFGPTLQRKILEATTQLAQRATRHRLAEADAHAAPLVEWLRGCRAARRVEPAGSLRRRKETIGDLDILVASDDPTKVADRFLRYGDVAEILARGEGKCSVRLKGGMQADLRIVPPVSFGAALHYFTGSKAHNIAIRKLGVRAGLKINEYGVFRGKKRISGAEEEDVFHAVGLPFIPPELREDRGEIDAARDGSLPELIELSDLRGDLHVHTRDSDGDSPLAEMVAAAAARGHAYVAITDHARAARGLDRAGFLAQARKIAALRREWPRMTILHGAEVDILPNGQLSLDDETLARLDVIIAAVHSKLDLPEREMTERVLRAMHHPQVNILAHPTGRLLGQREPSTIDLVEIARAAAELGVMLEIDAQPDRLDLGDAHIRLAKDAGALLVVSSDAHRTTELDYLRYGVEQARRGWCTAANVANSRSPAALRRLLDHRKKRVHAAAG